MIASHHWSISILNTPTWSLWQWKRVKIRVRLIWRKINFLVAAYSRKLNWSRLRRFNLWSFRGLRSDRNKFRWFLVRESTPLIRLPMRRHEREVELKRQEDNPADGQYAFRSCVLSAGQIATPVKRPLFAHGDLSYPPGGSYGRCTLLPSSWRRRRGIRKADNEKILRDILPRNFSHWRERRSCSCFEPSYLYFCFMTFMYFLSNSFCFLYVLVYTLK